METQNEIKSVLDNLFKLIGIESSVEVSEAKQGEETVYMVELDPGESAGLLIGAHGMTLAALQSFVTIAVNNKLKLETWIKITLDIAGWSKKQNERLTELATQTADRAKQTGEEQKLYNLNPSSRRMVHMALSEDSEIETLSEGEGQERYLVIRLRK